MSSLEKSVCIVYILVAIVIGGFSAYFKTIFNYASELTQTQEKLLGSALNYKKHGQVVNVDSNLCIREEPNLNSYVSYYLYEGMIFDILEKSDGWYKITYEDIIGYVKEDYIEEYDETPPNIIYGKMEKNLKLNDLMKNTTPIKAELTAYCNCVICSEEWGSQTSMQTHTRIGVIAAPKDIPLGSEIYIPELKSYKEDGIFNVEDRGGEVVVKSDRTHIIDIWLATHEQVKEFGRKKAIVYLLR